jgi:hypothetical protein
MVASGHRVRRVRAGLRRGVGVVLALVLGMAAFAVPPAFAAPAGKVLAWGYNGNGQLGNGTNTDSNVPVSVSLPPGTQGNVMIA